MTIGAIAPEPASSYKLQRPAPPNATAMKQAQSGVIGAAQTSVFAKSAE